MKIYRCDICGVETKDPKKSGWRELYLDAEQYVEGVEDCCKECFNKYRTKKEVKDEN